MENSFSATKGVRKIGELATDRVGELYQPGGEAFCCVFAPDQSRFAWSCGFRKVVLVPWNREKNCLISDDNKDAEGNTLSSEKISFDSGFRVYSLAFGTGIPEGELETKNYWTRFDRTKDLILATGHANGRIRIWDPYTGQLMLELTDHRQGLPVHSLAFAPDGSLRLASGSEDGTIKTWDLSDDGNMYKTLFDKVKTPVRDLCWSPDAKKLCSVGVKQKAFLWNMEECSLENRLIGHHNDVVSCTFSPDGALIATASNDTRVIIWDAQTGEQKRVLNHLNPPPGIIHMAGVNNYYVKGVQFLSDGTRVLSICSDGNMRIWDLRTEKDPLTIPVADEQDLILKCCTSPSGNVVALTYASGSAHFYRVPRKPSSLNHYCRMAVRKSRTNLSSSTIPPLLIKYLQYKHF